jgi:hypothetical protein
MAGAPLDREKLGRLDQEIEVDMLTPRRDGSVSIRPIWVVVVDGDAYVRSYKGASGAWYQRALTDHRAAIGIDEETFDVGLEPEHDEVLNERISDAFRQKYGRRAPGPTEAMVNAEVSATTLRLTQV